MPIKMTLDIYGIKGTSRAWDKLANYYGKDLTPLLNITAKWWSNSQGQIFRSQGSALEGRWKSLTDTYADWKMENYGPLPILTLTGRLSTAMKGLGSNAYKKQDKQSLEMGIKDIPYWRVHNDGFKSIPQRRYLGTTHKLMKNLDKDVQKDINRLDKEVNDRFKKGKGKKSR